MLQGNALNIEDKKLVLNKEQINSFFRQLMKCRDKYSKYEFVCLRHSLGLTQQEMANKSNVLRDKISKIELGIYSLLMIQ